LSYTQTKLYLVSSFSEIRSFISAINTFTLGHPNGIIPVWFYSGGPLLNNAFTSPYLYDTTPFRNTLDKSIHFEILRKTKEGEEDDDGNINNNNNNRNNNNNK
jgi:hypothetical protein